MRSTTPEGRRPSRPRSASRSTSPSANRLPRRAPRPHAGQQPAAGVGVDRLRLHVEPAGRLGRGQVTAPPSHTASPPHIDSINIDDSSSMRGQWRARRLHDRHRRRRTRRGPGRPAQRRRRPPPRSATCAGRRASTTTASTRRSSWPARAASRTCGSCCWRAGCRTPASRPGSPPRSPGCATLPDELRAAAARHRHGRPRVPAAGRAAHRAVAARGGPRAAAALGRRPGDAGGPTRCWSPRSPRPCSPRCTGCGPAGSRWSRAPTCPTAANWLYLVTGEVPEPDRARAIEQYLIATVDHGFNASTFTARVVTSTGADVAAAVVAALGALSGPLHGGAPDRALASLDEIGTPGPDRRVGARHGRRTATGSWASGTPSTAPTTRARCCCARSPAGWAASWSSSPTAVERRDRAGAGRAQARTPALRQRRVLRGRGDGAVRRAPADVHPDVRRQPGRRLVGARPGTGRERRIIRPSARYVGPPAPQPVPS